MYIIVPCHFSDGEYVAGKPGGSIKNIGITGSANDCARRVLEIHPSAIGVNWAKPDYHEQPRTCFAIMVKHGGFDHGHEHGYRSCLFNGMLIEWNMFC